MQTLLTTSPEEAAEILTSGGIVAFPTETVYGLGASVFDVGAIGRIFVAKQRPADNPLIAHVAELEQIDRLASGISEYALKFIGIFFPGPLTIVVTRAPEVPSLATAGLDTIGIRMPRSELARKFLAACGVPLVAPSANMSGRPSPTTWEAVYEDLDGRIDCILQGEPAEIGLESTVVDCTTEIPLVLRLGAVSLASLQSVVPATSLYAPGNDEVARSPGVRHKHYSPRARVILAGPIPGNSDLSVVPRPEMTERGLAAYIGLRPPEGNFVLKRICGSVDEYAHSVFDFFRECDRKGIDSIVCEPVTETGIGAALMDRLRRAADR